MEKGGGEDGSTLLLLSFTPRFSCPAQCAELVFLVDCSASMQGENIRLASEALQGIIVFDDFSPLNITHRLNMKLDLQSLLGLHVYGTAVLIG